MQSNLDLNNKNKKERDTTALLENNNFIVLDSKKLYIYNNIKNAPIIQAERLCLKVTSRKRKTQFIHLASALVQQYIIEVYSISSSALSCVQARENSYSYIIMSTIDRQ